MLGYLNITTGSTTPTLLCKASDTAPLKAVIVKNISVVNKGSVARGFNLLMAPSSGGAVYQLTPIDLLLAPNSQAIYDEEITLGSGDKVQVRLSTAGGDFDVVAFGMERDV